jgi:transcription initiation factor IIE alpha subunit
MTTSTCYICQSVRSQHVGVTHSFVSVDDHKMGKVSAYISPSQAFYESLEAAHPEPEELCPKCGHSSIEGYCPRCAN